MNPWIDVGLVAVIIVGCIFIISEVFRLARLFEQWEREQVEALRILRHQQ